jgi:opacity protein-like surface antigen
MPPRGCSFSGRFFMFAKLKLLAAAALLVLASTAAVAADYYVDITNKTGYTIMYMYVSPAKSDSWEEDVLGDDVLATGKTQRVNLNGYKSPMFDIRLVDEDGDKYTFWNVDVSTEDITVTLEDLDD